MKRPTRPILLTTLLALILSACGGNATPAAPTVTGPTAAATTGTSTNPTPAATGATSNPTSATGVSTPPQPSGSGASVIRVIVTGGPHAGTYDRTSTSATCSAGLTGDGSWGNQYSDDTITDGLSSLQLIVDDAKAAASGTSEFLTTLTFGKLFSQTATEYTIDTREGTSDKGRGTVKVVGDSKKATVTIQGEPEAGVQINATIQCNEVFSVDTGPTTPTPVPSTSATLNLTLEGGPQPGTFEVSSTEEVCGYGSNSGSVLTEGLDDPSDAWTVDYYDEGATNTLSRLELLIPKARDATGGTNVFYLSVNDQQYYYENLEGQEPDATGKVTLKNNGDTGTITLDLENADGSKVKGTIECRRVTR